MRVTELPRPAWLPRTWQVDNGERNFVALLPQGWVCTCGEPGCQHKAIAHERLQCGERSYAETLALRETIAGFFARLPQAWVCACNKHKAEVEEVK